MKKFLRHFRLAFLFAIAMFVICGFIYPMVLTGVSQVVFQVNQMEVLLK